MSRRWAVLPLVAALLSACATVPVGPSVMALPAPGKPFEQFRGDDGVCRQWAQQQVGITPGDAAAQSAVGTATIGTLIGAGLGAAIGAASGGAAVGAAIGAASGLVAGTAVGADAGHASGSAVQWRYDIAYQQCMYAKGNQVPVSIRPAYPYSMPPPPPPRSGAVPAPPAPRYSSATGPAPQPPSPPAAHGGTSAPSSTPPSESAADAGTALASRVGCQSVTTEGHYQTWRWPSGQRRRVWVPARTEQVC